MDCAAARAASDILVIGIGNPIRQDDGVGLRLVERLDSHFSSGLNSMTVFEPDIDLARRISGFRRLVVIDALARKIDSPYGLFGISPAETFMPRGGLCSHVFDWGMILAMARDIFGGCPEAVVLGVRAHGFEYSEELTPACLADAEEAFEFLKGYLSA